MCKSRLAYFQAFTHSLDRIFAFEGFDEQVSFSCFYFSRSFVKKPRASFNISFARRSSAFPVQSPGYGFSVPYRLAQLLFAYACFYFANQQVCNTLFPIGLPPFCSRFHPMSGWLLSNISYCTSIFSFPLSVFFYLSDFRVFVDSA